MQDQPSSRWDPSLYDDKHSFVWKYGSSLVELLEPRPGERIVDLGCGTGHLTAQLAGLGVEVTGIDSSPEMIEKARQSYPGLCFEVADARSFVVDRPVDAVFSNAVLHWIREPELVIRAIEQALKPGGRFVAELGGKGNVQVISTALREAAAVVGCEPPDLPWYFPSVGEYATLLEQHHLEVTHAVLFDRPTPLEGEKGLRTWVEMFGRDALGQIPKEKQQAFLEYVELAARPALLRDGQWHADYRRLRVVARQLSG